MRASRILSRPGRARSAYVFARHAPSWWIATSMMCCRIATKSSPRRFTRASVVSYSGTLAARFIFGFLCTRGTAGTAGTGGAVPSSYPVQTHSPSSKSHRITRPISFVCGNGAVPTKEW
jgi:hypothetical protein